MVARTLSSMQLEQPVVELSLLLPSWQFSALEEQAFAHGLTLAELLRQMIRERLGSLEPIALRREAAHIT